MLTEGQSINARYRILGEIAPGELGPVYYALDEVSQKACAVKMFHPPAGNAAGEMPALKQEMEQIRKLQHPHIAPVGELEETEDHGPFVVREFVEGIALEDVIRKEAPLPLSRACSIAKQIALALEAAHHAGIIHGDLTPSKVVLAPEEDEEKVKVFGFGTFILKKDRFLDLARLALKNGNLPAFGDPGYVSPEQATGMRSEALDGRSDVYALGIILYQMLAGCAPYAAESAMEVLLAHVFSEPRPLRDYPELEIPEALETLVMRMLAKNRQERPASATALVDQLSAWEQHDEFEQQRRLTPADFTMENVRTPPVFSEVEEPEPSQPIREEHKELEQGAQKEPAGRPVINPAASFTFKSPELSPAWEKRAFEPVPSQEEPARAPAVEYHTTPAAPVFAAPPEKPIFAPQPDISTAEAPFVADLRPEHPSAIFESPERETGGVDVQLNREPAASGSSTSAGRSAPPANAAIFGGYVLRQEIKAKGKSSHRWAWAVLVLLILVGTGCGWLYYTGRTYWFHPQFVKWRISSFFGQAANTPAPETPSPAPSQGTPTSSSPQPPPAGTVAPPAAKNPPANGAFAPSHPKDESKSPQPSSSPEGASSLASAPSVITPLAVPSTKSAAKRHVSRRTRISRSAGTQVSTPRQTTESSSSTTLQDVIAKGDSYFERGQYDDAIRAYEAGLAQDPANPKLLEDVDRARRAKAAEAKYLNQ